MTIEEKARAYDEALEKAKELLDSPRTCFDIVQLKDIFPQLRESEDERIRKWLYDYISNCPNNNFSFYGGVGKYAVLNYLEKQKEQKPKAKAKSPLSPHELYDAKIDGISQGRQDVLDHPEQFGLQKPAEWSEVELEFRGEKVKVERPFYRDDKGRGYSTAELDEGVAWNALRAWCEKKGISLYDLYPKAEWSEEDEDMLNCCISSIEEAKENRYAYKETDGDTSYDREIAFLKSLRPSWKPSEQKEQKLYKWSKKDKKILQSLHHVMNCADAQNAVKRDGLSVEDICNFLFSIEPSWKPSEEQMAGLLVAIGDEKERGSDVTKTLRSLYEQLKKL